MTTPRDLGYYMPAEWAPHRATWLSWPHKEASWPGKLDVIQPVYAQMVAALARSELVHINVRDAAMEAHARSLISAAGPTGEIVFHHFPTNDAWCRDHGAIFVVRNAAPLLAATDAAVRAPHAAPLLAATDAAVRAPHAAPLLAATDAAVRAPHAAPLLAATDWGYNAWGGKYPPFDLDNQIPTRMADYLGAPRFAGGMILEGGSIDVNGAGLLLTSEQCLLNPNRNPDLSREQIEQRLRDFLGVEKILWLGEGIVGDDTDGHIDDIARFVAADTIVTVVEEDPRDENYHILQENLQRLGHMTDLAGRTLNILTIPMPPAIIYEGQRLPASYANFYIGNSVVLLPTYNHPNDQRAAEVLTRCFPERMVIGIDCRDIIWGLGAWHCLTQQVPM